MTTAQLSLRLDADVSDPHAEARRHVIAAIATAAELNRGRVSPNAVRALLAAVPGRTLPRGLVGAVYRDLRRLGVLVPTGTERSDDVAGGNAGRLIETFTWTEVPA